MQSNKRVRKQEEKNGPYLPPREGAVQFKEYLVNKTEGNPCFGFGGRISLILNDSVIWRVVQVSDRYHRPFYSGHHSDRQVCMLGQQEWGGKGEGW